MAVLRKQGQELYRLHRTIESCGGGAVIEKRRSIRRKELRHGFRLVVLGSNRLIDGEHTTDWSRWSIVNAPMFAERELLDWYLRAGWHLTKETTP